MVDPSGPRRIYFPLNMWDITYWGPVVTVKCPKTMNILSSFRCRPTSKVGKMFKYKISTSYLISNKASILIWSDMKYHTRSCSGHGKWSQISRLWSNANEVFVHCGTIISWSCHYELKQCCYRAEICKIVLIVAITALPVSIALAELSFLCRTVLFHKNFPTSGEQPEHRELAHEL